MRFLVVILGAACVHASINCPSLDGNGAHKQLMGGASAEKPADEDVNQLLKDTTKWQDEVLKQRQAAGENLAELGAFRVCSYNTQVVAGINYVVKVGFEDGSFSTVKIYKPLPYMNQPPQLTSVHDLSA